MMAFLSAGIPSGGVYRISPVFNSEAQLMTASTGALLLGSTSQVNDGLALFSKQCRGFIQLEGCRLLDRPGQLTEAHSVHLLIRTGIPRRPAALPHFTGIE